MAARGLRAQERGDGDGARDKGRRRCSEPQPLSLGSQWRREAALAHAHVLDRRVAARWLSACGLAGQVLGQELQRLRRRRRLT